MLYHAGVPGVSGGLLGVDVFFVLSGFLITWLLGRELLGRHTVGLVRFWGRRARRLLPALFFLLLGVALYARAFAGQTDLALLRGDALSSLLYFANWHFVFAHQGYFAQSAAPSPLLHLWSLGVEEQYYLVWPPVALFAFGRGGLKALAWVAGIGAMASAILMLSMEAAGFSVDRLYYGTDTRAQALLVGSFLGAIASHDDWRVLRCWWTGTSAGRRTGRSLGWVGAAGLLWAWHALDGQDGFLYRGGFFLVALATASVIATVTTWPHSGLAQVCSLRPLVYVGRISYGLYLYHWPIFLALDHAHTGLSGPSLLAARLVATFALAAISFAAVEEPIRRSTAFTRWRGLALAGAAGVGVAAVLVVATTVPPSPPVTTAVAAGARMPAALRKRLAAAHAFTTDPVRFLLAGDSQVLTLGEGLRVGSRRRYGVDVIDGGVLACDLDPGLPIRYSGEVVRASTNCRGWQNVWPRYARQVRASVVGVLVGRWELYDHYYKGRWTHVGERRWDTHLRSRLTDAVKVLEATDARVVLFTAPYSDPGVEAADGAAFPENSPSRVDEYNKIIRQVATSTEATVIDLNRLLDPHGTYARAIGGVIVRSSDGIHISVGGGEWLQPRILPAVAELGLTGSRKHRVGPPGQPTAAP